MIYVRFTFTQQVIDLLPFFTIYVDYYVGGATGGSLCTGWLVFRLSVRYVPQPLPVSGS